MIYDADGLKALKNKHKKRAILAAVIFNTISRAINPHLF
jgi:hypothetical protein